MFPLPAAGFDPGKRSAQLVDTDGFSPVINKGDIGSLGDARAGINDKNSVTAVLPGTGEKRTGGDLIPPVQGKGNVLFVCAVNDADRLAGDLVAADRAYQGDEYQGCDDADGKPFY